MVDSRGPLGGVCLNVGCIPSKALLHAAKVIAETKEMSHAGLTFTAPTIDLDALRGWKDGVVTRLTGGLAGLAKQRKVTTLVGTGTFTSPNMLTVTAPDGSTIHRVVRRRRSSPPAPNPSTLPFIPHDDPRVIDSTGALDLDNIPERLLVLGGGIIGLEMACVYSELGTKISVVELMDQLIPGADKDLVTPLTKTDRQGLRGDLAGHQGHRRHRRTRRPHRHPRRLGLQGQGQGPRDRHLRQGAGRRRTPPQRPRRSAPTPPGCSSTNADSSRSTNNNAPTSPTSSPSATSSANPCSPTKPPTKARSPPRTPPATPATSTPPSSPPSPTPTPKSPGSASPRTKPKPPGSNTAKACSPGPPPAAPCRWAATKASPKSCSTRPPTASSAPASSAPTPATSSPKSPWPSRSGADAADIGLTIHPHPTLSETVAMAAEAFEGTITDLYMPKKK